MKRTVLRATAAPRAAFTMIELLIVIVVIAILVALLLPAVGGARARARIAQVSSEISNLEKAIADFKLKYGVEPPSYLRLHEDPSNWTNTDEQTRHSRAFIQRIWPQFDFSYGSSNRDYNGQNGDTEVLELNGAECLLFFLGGPGLEGFSTNPANPFSSGGSRVGPFHEFDPARLVDLDGDNIPEYLDPLPNQQMPYQYFSAYEGRGYRVDGLDDTNGNADDEAIIDTLRSVYLQEDDEWSNAGVAPEGTPWKPNGFQIISAGFDGASIPITSDTNPYGVGGAYSSESGLQVKRTTDVMRDLDHRKFEQDNISNVSSNFTKLNFP